MFFLHLSVIMVNVSDKISERTGTLSNVQSALNALLFGIFCLFVFFSSLLALYV